MVELGFSEGGFCYSWKFLWPCPLSIVWERLLALPINRSVFGAHRCIYPARLICTDHLTSISVKCAGVATKKHKVYWWPLPTVLGQLCACAESTWSAVCIHSRCGWQWATTCKYTFYDTHVLWTMIQSILKLFSLITVDLFAYKSLRCPDHPNWRFSSMTTDIQTNHIIPCTCVWG